MASLITAHEIVASVRELAVLPASYTRLNAVLSSPDATAETIAAVVELDPALSVRLLKHANSAAYSPARPVSSLAHATSMVGTSTLRTLALATGIVRMFRGVPEHLLSMKSFWTHSVAVATAAQLLATRSRRVSPQTAFLAGLLHDVGELLLCLKCPNEARLVIMETDRRGDPNTEVERDVLGFTHAELGGSLMRAWGLAEHEVSVAVHHHAPSACPPADQPLVDHVHLADVLVSALQIGNSGERAAHPLDTRAWDRIGLAPSDIRELIPAIDTQMGSLAETLSA